MDNSILLIAIGSSILFIGIVIWKITWLLRKIDKEQVTEEND